MPLTMRLGAVWDPPSLTMELTCSKGSTAAFQQLTAGHAKCEVLRTVIVADCNPAYDAPERRAVYCGIVQCQDCGEHIDVRR